MSLTESRSSSAPAAPYSCGLAPPSAKRSGAVVPPPPKSVARRLNRSSGLPTGVCLTVMLGYLALNFSITWPKSVARVASPHHDISRVTFSFGLAVVLVAPDLLDGEHPARTVSYTH